MRFSMNPENRNVRRFDGIAALYESARPQLPVYPAQVIGRYLGRRPDTVVDLGCGTGLSTVVWEGRCRRVIGVEPNEGMLAVARRKESGARTFIRAFAHETGLPEACADAVVCSQSFHWMEPAPTLDEAARLLADGGVFAAVDCDWPPVCGWPVEKAYDALFEEVRKAERRHPEIAEGFRKWEKSGHLANIRSSGHFRYAREIVFANEESCDAERMIALARSQGGLQGILTARPELIAEALEAFERAVREYFAGKSLAVGFCYRMRVGVK